MGFTIVTLTLLLVFSAVPSIAQLNYEGNPLTEDTEYAAEETQLLERSSRTDADTVLVNNVPQKLYPVYAKDARIDTGKIVTANNTNIEIQKSIEINPKQLQLGNLNLNEARNLQDNSLPYNLDTNKQDVFLPYQQQSYLPDIALNSFLQSQTPEESKLALEHYLKNQESQSVSFNEPVQTQVHQIVNNDVLQQSLPYQTSNIDFQQQPQNNLQFQHVQNFQPSPVVNFQPTPAPSSAPVFHQNSAPIFQSNSIQSSYQPDPQIQNVQYQQNPSVQVHPIQVQSHQMYPFQQQSNKAPDMVMNSVSSPSQMQNYPVQTPQEAISAMIPQRVPMKYAPFKHPRQQGRPRIRNKIPQQRISPAHMYKSPPPIIPSSYPPHSPSLPPPPHLGVGKYKGPVEVIYTKPPGYRPPVRHAASGPYAEASSWYPEVNHSPAPSQKDIFWSQLYAQSYDPHYYNYIAKTGKIKPHLYGKFHEHNGEDDGIWSEIVKGFKKHGLKNIMNPGFLLGMTIPALTLMLTALVQKRSLARADFGPPTVNQEKLDEYTAKLHKALQMFDENKRIGTGNTRRRR